MKKIMIILFFVVYNLFGQQKHNKIKLGFGTSLYNINENFNNIFLFNNSSPVIIGVKKDHFRLETISNISFINQKGNSNFIAGSVRLGLDYIIRPDNKFQIYFGSQYGLNTNNTHLINFHLGGEFFLHPNWSISNQIGLNFLSDTQKLTQTNSSIILRFYLKIKK